MHPTNSDSNFKSSIKKYFLTNVTTVPIFFNFIYEDLKDPVSGNSLNKWACITFDEKLLGTVTEAFVSIDLFTKKDVEGDTLSTITDEFLNVLIDEDSTNHTPSIPFLNYTSGTGEVVGGIMPFITRISPERDFIKGMKIKTITLQCKWGAK